MRWHIALGTLGIVVSGILLAVIGINEPDRMESFTRSYQSRQIEIGATIYESSCRTCHGPQGRGIEGVAPSINAADLFTRARLDAVGYSGTLEDYLRGVIAAGRPIQSEGASYPQRMPTWGQEFGGPLRTDQVESLVTFIMNWETRALAEAEDVPTIPPGDMVGTEMKIPLPPGDPEAGEALSEGSLGCVGCHVLAAVGPVWAAEGDLPGIGARAATRIEEDSYTGEATTAEEYLIESVVLTNAHIVDGYLPDIMPGNYGERMTVQELADLVAYMETFR